MGISTRAAAESAAQAGFTVAWEHTFQGKDQAWRIVLTRKAP